MIQSTFAEQFNEKTAEILLSEFDNLPKQIREPTYLEICRYPRRRFEEICSRILCFYIAPKNEHGFNDLFLKSLFELLGEENVFFKDEQVRVISEENSEGKRLDILIHSPTFVIGIENKITASLYNPLDTYKNRIDLYGTEKIFRVVLSLRKIVDRKELEVLHKNHFIQLTYFELFETVKRRIGTYLNNANPKYLTFLTDFIQTLENMSGQNVLNEKLANYFYDNSTRIDSLIELYEKYNARTHSLQAEKTTELKDKIVERTKNDSWWIWEGTGLGINKFNSSKPIIGIMSYYCEIRGNALGEFVIYITTWNYPAWAHYEEKVLKKYPNRKLEKKDNRVHLEMDYIEDGSNEELILDKLEEYYNFLKELTKED